MIISQRLFAAVVLVGIVVIGVVLSKAFSGTDVAGYVLSFIVVLCIATTWFFTTSSKNTTFSDSDAGGKRKKNRTLLKGTLSLLTAIGWAVVVTAAVHGGIVASEVTTILWALTPTFTLIIVGMVYFVRGFNSNF